MKVSSVEFRLFKGSYWVGMLKGSSSVLNLLKLAVLTHFIGPEEFGVFGLALLIIDVFLKFSTPGFRPAMIQMKGNVESYLNVSWSYNILRMVFSAFILFFMAPVIGGFFETPEAIIIIRVIAVILIIQGFTNSAEMYLIRDMQFKKHFQFHFIGAAIEFLATIIFAYILRDIWALVIGYFFRMVTLTLMSFIMFSFRPTFHLDFEKIGHLFKYGKWILGASLITFFASYLDNLVIGKILGATALGFYQMAHKLSVIPSKQLAETLSTVLFPLYAKKQEKPELLRRLFFNVLRINLLFSGLINASIFLFIGDFTSLFLGSDWGPIIPIARIFAIASFLASVSGSGDPLFKGIGYPKYVMHIQLIKLLVLVICIYPLVKIYGLPGAVMALIGAELSAVVIWLVHLNKLLPKSGSHVMGIISLCAISTFFVVIWDWIFIQFIPSDMGQSYLFFIIRLFSGIIMYASVSIVLLLRFYPSINIKSLLKGIKAGEYHKNE